MKMLHFYLSCHHQNKFVLLQEVSTNLKDLILVTCPFLLLNYVRVPTFQLSNLFINVIVQLYTYQRAFIMKFTEVSARLDIELLVSQKRRREVVYCIIAIVIIFNNRHFQRQK